MAISTAGVGLVLIGLIIAFWFSLCSIGGARACTSGEHAAATVGIVMALVGIFGSPGLAAVVTRRWWWSLSPVLLSLALLGYELVHHSAATIHSAALMLVAAIVEVGTVVAVLACLHHSDSDSAGVSRHSAEDPATVGRRSDT